MTKNNSQNNDKELRVQKALGTAKEKSYSVCIYIPVTTIMVKTVEVRAQSAKHATQKAQQKLEQMDDNKLALFATDSLYCNDDPFYKRELVKDRPICFKSETYNHREHWHTGEDDPNDKGYIRK